MQGLEPRRYLLCLPLLRERRERLWNHRGSLGRPRPRNRKSNISILKSTNCYHLQTGQGHSAKHEPGSDRSRPLCLAWTWIEQVKATVPSMNHDQIGQGPSAKHEPGEPIEVYHSANCKDLHSSWSLQRNTCFCVKGKSEIITEHWIYVKWMCDAKGALSIIIFHTGCICKLDVWCKRCTLYIFHIGCIYM